VKGGDKVIKYPEELRQAEILKNLERMKKKREMAGWVSVKDRLPGRDAPYLVFIPTADDSKPLTLIAWYDPGGFGWSGIVEYWVCAITHWMELPDWPEDYKKEVADERI